MNQARRFGSQTSQVETFDAAAALDNLVEWTWGCWVFPIGAGAGRGRLMDKGTGTDGTKYLALRDDGTLAGEQRTLQASQKRATLQALAISANATWEYLAWYYLAATYTAAAGVRLYVAPLGADVAEVTYASTQIGSGAETADAAFPLRIGNTSDGLRHLNAAVTGVVCCAAALTAAELTAAAYEPRVARVARDVRLAIDLGHQPVDLDLASGSGALGRPDSMPWPGPWDIDLQSARGRRRARTRRAQARLGLARGAAWGAPLAGW